MEHLGFWQLLLPRKLEKKEVLPNIAVSLSWQNAQSYALYLKQRSSLRAASRAFRRNLSRLKRLQLPQTGPYLRTYCGWTLGLPRALLLHLIISAHLLTCLYAPNYLHAHGGRLNKNVIMHGGSTNLFSLNLNCTSQDADRRKWWGNLTSDVRAAIINNLEGTLHAPSSFHSFAPNNARWKRRGSEGHQTKPKGEKCYAIHRRC